MLTNIEYFENNSVTKELKIAVWKDCIFSALSQEYVSL